MTLHGRIVVDVEVQRGVSRDVVDAFIAAATWDDTGEPLADDDLEALQNIYPEFVDEYAVAELGCWH